MKHVLRNLLPALAALAASPLAAQVGHAPDDSPFHDIRSGTSLELIGGSLLGNGGPIPVGPRDGPVAGIRILLRAKSTISLGFAVWGANAKRTPIDPTSLANRFGEPVDQDLFAGELTIQFNLTGGKTWHGLAPFAGLGLGLVKSDLFHDVEADPYNYEFGTKFFFAPSLGTRVFVGRSSYIRLEARGLTWKLKYPTNYSLEPNDSPGTEENPNAVNPLGRSGQYVLSPSLQAGFGFWF